MTASDVSAPQPSQSFWATDREWFADGLPDLFYGLAFLVTALFFFVWGGFGVGFVLFVGLGLGSGNFFRGALAAAKAALADPAPAAALRRAGRRPGWGTVVKIAILALLVVLAVARAVRLDITADVPALAWSIERWWTLILTVPIPLMFVASAFQLRLPRHLVVGVVALVGALAGPLLGLAWRDALALAAAVLGIVLVATGAAALGLHLRDREVPRSAEATSGDGGAFGSTR